MQYLFWLIIGIILVLAIILFIHYLKLKEIHEIIETCTSKIIDVMEEKKRTVKAILEKVKNVELKNSYIFDGKEDMFTLEEILFRATWDINKEGETLRKNKASKKLLKELKEEDEALEGLKDFYNVKMTKYNNIYNKKPFKFIYKMLHFYPGRLFSIRKIEDYEILKN